MGGKHGDLEGFMLPAILGEVRTSWKGRLEDVRAECTRLESALKSAGKGEMSRRRRMAVALTGLVFALSACAGPGEQKKVMMDDQQVLARAGEIVQQTLGAMSPKPTPKRDGRYGAGACLADPGKSDRQQVHISYRLEGVPGSAGRQLVREARDAWVERGFKFTSDTSDGDWSDPGTAVHMATVPDDYWLTISNSVTDRATGDGTAVLTVTSPCYFPTPGESASPSPQALSADGASLQRALGHSSRIHDSLRVRHAAASGAELRTIEHEGATYVHHAWSTEPLPEDRAARAMARAHGYLEGAGWRVRSVPGRLVALNPADEVAAQLARADHGGLNVGITGPTTPVLHGSASV
ncbi:hypothetical protein OG592_15545 [Streptomyces avidinii]|uniref:hypothetical protein n=1 Tax=Streptomyces avidinii TaxID=1895 RepID=UPI0038652651|nr:hypothetical protein OG592_15545 [Streptomyces avidinii]